MNKIEKELLLKINKHHKRNYTHWNEKSELGITPIFEIITKGLPNLTQQEFKWCCLNNHDYNRTLLLLWVCDPPVHINLDKKFISLLIKKTAKAKKVMFDNSTLLNMFSNIKKECDDFFSFDDWQMIFKKSELLFKNDAGFNLLSIAVSPGRKREIIKLIVEEMITKKWTIDNDDLRIYGNHLALIKNIIEEIKIENSINKILKIKNKIIKPLKK